MAFKLLIALTGLVAAPALSQATPATPATPAIPATPATPPTADSPAIPATINPMQARRTAVAGSLNRKMPRIATPTVPIPVQTA